MKLELLRIARELLAARPLKPEKLVALMQKIRKGAGTYKGSELRQVFDYLGGWTVREITLLEPMGKSKNYMEQEDRPVQYSNENKANVEGTRQLYKDQEVQELPDVKDLKLHERVYMDVGDIRESESSWAKDKEGKPVKNYWFSYRGWQVVRGTEITSPEGVVWTKAISLQEFDNQSPVITGVLKWLKSSTNFLAQLSAKLGLPTFEAEREEKIRQKKIPTLENTGTCPCCFGVFKLTPAARKGSDRSLPGMILHGYKRPGDSRVHGECFGRDWPPFELSSEGTVAWIAVLESENQISESYLKRLNAGEVEQIPNLSGTKLYIKGKIPADEWERVLRGEIEDTGYRINRVKREIERLEKAVKDWVPAKLP